MHKHLLIIWWYQRIALMHNIVSRLQIYFRLLMFLSLFFKLKSPYILKHKIFTDEIKCCLEFASKWYRGERPWAAHCWSLWWASWYYSFFWISLKLSTIKKLKATLSPCRWWRILDVWPLFLWLLCLRELTVTHAPPWNSIHLSKEPCSPRAHPVHSHRSPQPWSRCPQVRAG